MLKKLAACVLICFWGQAMAEGNLFPSLDLVVPSPLPKYFRMPSGPFIGKDDKTPTRDGLDLMRASASGQFNPTNFFFMLNRIPNQKILVVDLREESHGFINGIPVSWKFPTTTWTNVRKNLKEIEDDERRHLNRAFAEKSVTLDPLGNPFPLDVWSTISEKDLLANMGIDYVRIPITENHKPSDLYIDQIIALLTNLPKDTWLHIHCHGGRGRTTLFLIIFDILVNAKKIPLEDIILRQKLLGGSDLYKVVDKDTPKYKPLQDRIQFVKKFYEYGKTADTAKIPWSLWLKQQSDSQNSE